MVAPLSFVDRVHQAMSTALPARPEGFDGMRTINLTEASEIGQTLWETQGPERKAATALVGSILANPKNFSTTDAADFLRRDYNWVGHANRGASADASGVREELQSMNICRQAAGIFASKLPGKLMVLRLPGNAGRPVAVYVPPGFDPEQKATLVTYFHGIGTEIGPTLAGRDNGLIDKIAALGPQANAIYVIPQGVPDQAHAAQTWPSYGMNFDTLDTQARRVASELIGAKITVGATTKIGHSGAGLVFADAAARNELHADKYVFLDCFYGTWAKPIAEALVKDAGQRKALNLPPIDIEYFTSSNVGSQQTLVDLFFDLVNAETGITATRHKETAVHASLPGRFTEP